MGVVTVSHVEPPRGINSPCNTLGSGSTLLVALDVSMAVNEAAANDESNSTVLQCSL